MNIQVDDAVLSGYLFYAAILALKVLAMVPLTARQRFAKKVMSNPEDLQDKTFKVAFTDPDVERVRRAHHNDLENIPVFLILGFLYVLTNPSAYIAMWLFRVFTAARIFHTIFYLNAVPQPSRGIAFFVGFLITIYISVQVILSQM